MAIHTEDKNLIKKNKLNTNSLSKNDNDFFTFNIAPDIYDVFVDLDNVLISSDEMNFECSKQKLEIKNNIINVGIVKDKHSFKVLLKNPKIDFKDNKSLFQIKTKKDLFIISINTPFKISVNGEHLLFSSDVNKTINLYENFTPKQKAEISQMKDNRTLLISEEKKKTFLPYTINDLCAKYDSTKYNTIQELIEKEYTVPNEYYHYPMFSRFKEGYKLIKEKERGTAKKAIDLGFELMFNFNLNPPIITACKNLEELNIYLDCLEENELNKFSCFDIVYEVPPAKLK